MKNEAGKSNYGYLMVVAAWLVYFCASTPISYGTSVISTKIVMEQGWNEGIIGFASSVSYAFIAVACILGSHLIQKKGCRFAIIAGSIIGILSYAMLFLFPSSESIYVAMFGMAGVSSALCGLISGPSLVNMWFKKNQSFPMAMLMTAGSIGGFLMPVAAHFLADISIGLCWIVYGVMMGIVLVVACIIIRDEPTAMNTEKAEKTEKATKSAMRSTVLTEKDCYRSGKFYSLSLQQILAKGISAGVNSYLVLYALQNHVDAGMAALLLTVCNVANLLGRITAGFVDRLPLDRRQLNTMAFAAVVSGCVILFFAKTFAIFAVGSMVCGLSAGLLLTMAPVLTAICFGHENFAVVNGTMNSLGFLGSTLGPIVIFAVANRFGGYQYSYLTLGILAVMGIVLAALTPIRRLEVSGAKREKAEKKENMKEKEFVRI